MMSIVRHNDPFEVFRLISDSVFDDAFFGRVSQPQGYPKFDQFTQEDGSVILEFPLAGYKLSDLSIETEGSRLTVKAERSQNKTTGERTVSGRSTQSFEKSFTADKNLDLENITASFEDGLLVINVPSKKIEKPPIKKIEISTNKLLK